MNYPDGEWWNTDQSERRENRKDELRSLLPKADVVGVVDSDSDGLACEVVLREAYPDSNVVVIHGRGGEYGFNLPDTFSLVGDYTDSDTRVVVADLAPDSQFSSFLAGLSKVSGDIHIYDHHDWEWFVRESISGMTENIVVGDDKCAAQIVQENEHPVADAQLMEFLEVTADHDLWRKNDERSDHLSTLSFRLDREDYVEAARTHGADMVEADDKLREVYVESEKEAENRKDIAVERAEWEDYNGYNVAMTYGDCHQSRVGDELLNQGADIAVVVQPTLKLSFRSTEDADVSAELARGLGGGGHPTAAGAKLYSHVDVPAEANKFEYVWETDGQPALSTVAEYLSRTEF
jgi:oligoribonuclease NrnB/cAMP/cGMP phosphodiesterase (DHH superfamily)